MKKFTLALIALVLVCSCAFAATYTVTAGLGFGGYMIPKKDVIPDEGWIYDMGPAAFVGFDYVNDNGLTIYDDVAFNLAMLDNGNKPLADKKIYVTGTEYLGLGYTFNVNKFDIMAGAGVEAKMSLTDASELTSDFFYGGIKSFVSIGAGLRCKANYAINENWGVSFQLNGSFMFKNIFSTVVPDVAAELDKKGFKFVSGNALIGATYKF